MKDITSMILELIDQAVGQKCEELSGKVLLLESEVHRLKGNQTEAVVKDWYTPNDVSKLIGISADGVRRGYIKTGRIDAKFENGRWLIARPEFERIEKLPKEQI